MLLSQLNALKAEILQLPLGSNARLTDVRARLLRIIALVVPEPEATYLAIRVRSISFEPVRWPETNEFRGFKVDADFAWESGRAKMFKIAEAIEASGKELASRIPPNPATPQSRRDIIAAPTAISYVRGYCDDKVIKLAAQLRECGVPCELDIYQVRSPDGGWSRNMARLMRMPFVLVVCSETYYERYTLADVHGGGGVAMESGLLSRRFTEKFGREHGIIPVVFEDGDEMWRPDFLRDETYYRLPRDFEALYAVLTDQLPPKPRVGRIRPPTTLQSQSWDVDNASNSWRANERQLMLFLVGNSVFDLPYESLIRDETLRVVLRPCGPRTFEELRLHRKRFGVAWGLYAAVVTVSEYREIITDGTMRIELTLVEQELVHSEQLAKYDTRALNHLFFLCAQKILLSEIRIDDLPFAVTPWQAFTLEGMLGDVLSLIREYTTLGLAALTGSKLQLDEMKLLFVAFLRLNGVVQRIHKLELALTSEGIRIEFIGVCEDFNDNRKPYPVYVFGTRAMPSS
jgi:hypothetical protein